MTAHEVKGEFLKRGDTEYYVIRNVDQIPPFFISMVSDQDHWLFAGSQGGISAGRVSPETALFPYLCVDKLYDNAMSSGARSLFKGTHSNGKAWTWEPFNYEQDGKYAVTRNLYKSVLGNALCYEEINHDLEIAFEYTWYFSDQFGLCRIAKATNLSEQEQVIEVLDGVQNILPAGTPRFTQTQSSNLVDAYKWTELEQGNKLALFTLYSAITDRAEPVEALRASTVFSFADDHNKAIIDPLCVRKFKRNEALDYRVDTRGVRGVYFNHLTRTLGPKQHSSWGLAANTEQDQGQISQLRKLLEQPEKLHQDIMKSIAEGSNHLACIMAKADGFQLTAEKEVSVHHYANTLFNVLRGGIFANQYQISKTDFIATVRHFNQNIADTCLSSLNALGDWITLEQLQSLAQSNNNMQLLRLVNEYLPITFGRRHGDPSRPWNQFAIELKDGQGNALLSYQGNWRDIFQNWEALALSYPKFIDSMIAKFVNASTMDGYNPYRITKKGIDWEVEEPDDPWSYIGYWGDHQIIYLLKLLEVSQKFSPATLTKQLTTPCYSYANVPYRIRSYQATLANPKQTVDYDWHASEQIEKRVESLGADGKLVLNQQGQVYQVTLLEKLLVPLITKLNNLVIDGGIWLNTQRPEWNDANNALVGQGLSMVTLYYMHRYLKFLQDILAQAKASGLEQFEITNEVAEWLVSSLECMQTTNTKLSPARAETHLIKAFMDTMGNAGQRYRDAIYSHDGSFKTTIVTLAQIMDLLNQAMALVRHSIAHNRDTDGLYHSYNTLKVTEQTLTVSKLYPMLEGQVSALSSGALSPSESLGVLKTLFNSDMYRSDINTFLLYADRTQTRFMNKNQLASEDIQEIPVIAQMIRQGDARIIYQDTDGIARFNSHVVNADALATLCNEAQSDYSDLADENVQKRLLNLFESTFNHSQFTGRSGGMFGFEGLGCVYWHMISKLLLAVLEVTQQAHADNDPALDKLIAYYYKIREGIGYNKTPEQYGAFPTDPYSHTPKHAGAQQPGMTGQVKEEIITRFGELGCQVQNGCIQFAPFLLRAQEFMTQGSEFTYLNVNDKWQTLDVPHNSIAFTWCQVPIIYCLDDSIDELQASVEHADHTISFSKDGQLDTATSQHIFDRDSEVTLIIVRIPSKTLYQQ
ncbi:hypothetical protein [Glaciecola sp. SC05]|uniref:hypothetical protein n=1 Tax=Glaciecola sp. SC05 TaxID=1987355 RepID=UPI003527E5C1